MNKPVGWAIGGAVLSITVGVLVGLVLHAGQMERADRLPQPAPSSLSARVTQTGEYVGLTNTAPTEMPSTTPAPTLAPTELPSTTPTPPSPSAPVTQTGTDTGPTNTGPGETTGTPAGTSVPGSNSAGQPCPTLAGKSADAAGTTLFCQVDQTDRTLRWRAVVDRGGCLSQSMTGVAADGRIYQCRLDASGLNHWALAG